MTGNGNGNGNGRAQDGRVRVAIVGVGNCASSLVQGVHYYRDAADDEFVPGLMHVNLGGYHVRDIEFVAAFDVDADKVGKDLSQAIVSGQNNTINFAEVPHTGVTVQRGMTHDGLGKYLSEIITKADGPTADIATILKESKADVLVSYLPVGSEEATKWYDGEHCHVPEQSNPHRLSRQQPRSSHQQRRLQRHESLAGNQVLL